jgi:hypothetical protein
VNDGARTRDNRNHNPALYQLSYAHHYRKANVSRNGALGRTRTCDPRLRRPMLYPAELQALMVGVEGFEPPTSCSQSRRATRLRYTPYVFLIWLVTFSATLEELPMITMSQGPVKFFFWFGQIIMIRDCILSGCIRIFIILIY